MKGPRLLTLLTVGGVTLALILMPYERSGSVQSVINFLVPFAAIVAIFAILTIGLNVQWGYTGILNFGVAAFFMVGAYTGAIFTKDPASSDFVRYVGGFGDTLAFLPFLDSREWLPFIIAMLAAGAASALLALLLAGPALRLREDYLAIATIGIAEVARRITIEQQGLVNGNRGLTGIPRPLAGWYEPDEYKWVFLGIAVLVLLLMYILVERGIRSPWGRVLRALREDEDATAASGKNVAVFKLQAFVLGAAIMGMGGALFGFQQGTISPDTFDHFFGTFLIWAMLIVGGSGNNAGAIVGAYVVWGFWSITLQLQGYDLPDVIAVRIPFIREFVVGSLIVIVLLLRPQGLLPEQARVSRWLERRVRELQRDARRLQEKAADQPESAPAE